MRDLTASLAEGVATHRAALSRRLDTPVVVQLDEPSLPAALGGRLSGVTALSPVAALDEAVAETLLDTCAAAWATTCYCTVVRPNCRGNCWGAVVLVRCQLMPRR